MAAFGKSIDKYDIFELLGRGSFGQVYRARVRESGMDVAIKMIDKKQIKDARMANRVKQEVSIHSQLKHPSVVELYTFFEDERNVYLVLELCHKGTLQSYFRSSLVVFWEPQAQYILRQVVDGLIYLHERNIIHRDITLANLLLTYNTSVKIGDFGLATQLSSPDEKHMSMCGTPNYISPEIAVRGSHGLETDVWGLGVILYILLVGKYPFATENRKMIPQLVATREVEFPEHLSPDCIDLMKLLLKKNPKDRIRLTQILQHPFMTHSLFSFNNPSSQRGSRDDSGVATSTSVSSASQTRSYTDRVLDGRVVRTPVHPQYPLGPSSKSSNHSVQKSYGLNNYPSLENKPPSVTNGALHAKSQIVPLNTTRLKPIRQKTKQVILNILETGEVCLEFIKQKNKSKNVFEVLRISKDGQWITVYYPNKGKGVSPSDSPPSPPCHLGEADGIFLLENLPEKFAKKYSYASRFVDLVKAQTPKVIYYTDEAKCMLMENGPDADFQVHFYDGAKLNKSGSQVKVTDENGYTSTQYVGSDETELPPPVKNMWNHFKYWLEKCKSLEKVLDELSSSTGGCVGVFPNRSGERPKRNANTPTTKKPSSEVGRSGVGEPDPRLGWTHGITPRKWDVIPDAVHKGISVTKFLVIIVYSYFILLLKTSENHHRK